MVGVKIDGWNTGFFVDRIRVTSRNAQLRSGTSQVIHGKIIQVIRPDSIQANTKIINQIGNNNVGVADGLCFWYLSVRKTRPWERDRRLQY
jgi:hypothetical protein